MSLMKEDYAKTFNWILFTDIHHGSQADMTVQISVFLTKMTQNPLLSPPSTPSPPKRFWVYNTKHLIDKYIFQSEQEGIYHPVQSNPLPLWKFPLSKHVTTLYHNYSCTKPIDKTNNHRMSSYQQKVSS